jgi:hypothetical protein
MQIAIIGALVGSESVTELAREFIHRTKQKWVGTWKRLVETWKSTTDASVWQTAIPPSCSAINRTVGLGAGQSMITLEALTDLLLGIADTVTRAVLWASKVFTHGPREARHALARARLVANAIARAISGAGGHVASFATPSGITCAFAVDTNATSVAFQTTRMNT